MDRWTTNNPSRRRAAPVLVVLVVFAWTLAPRTGIAQTPVFTPANDDADIHFVHTLNDNDRFSRYYGSGPAAADYDRDGDIDVFIPQAFGYPNALYRNRGDGTFEEVAATAQVASLKESRAALWLDYDNDGWLDLFVANDAGAPPGQVSSDPQTVSNLLYRNLGDGTFADVSVAADIDQMPLPEADQTTGGLSAGDINNDGYLDIYVACWQNMNALYLNDGDGTFTQISQPALVSEPNYSWQPVFYDIDRDGWTDLLLNMDFTANHLYRNLGNNTFSDVAGPAGFDNAFNEMGMTLGDYDNDGDMDVLATNIELPYADPNNQIKYTILLRNDSTTSGLAFTERAQSAGVDRTGWGWGCTWFDANNDGYLDLGVTNGMDNLQSSPFISDPSRFFLNQADGTFAELSDTVGFSSTRSGRGLIAFDYDADGDLDLYEVYYGNEAALFRNDTPNNGHWLAIDLIASTPTNRFAVGSEIRVTAGGITQLRAVTVGTSFLSQEPYRRHVGLGDATSVDAIEVRWHTGETELFTNIQADQRIRIRQGVGVLAAEDVDADGDVDFSDGAMLVGCMSGPGASTPPGCASADLTHNGHVDLLDYWLFQRELFGGP